MYRQTHFQLRLNTEFCGIQGFRSNTVMTTEGGSCNGKDVSKGKFKRYFYEYSQGRVGPTTLNIGGEPKDGIFWLGTGGGWEIHFNSERDARNAKSIAEKLEPLCREYHR